MTQTTTVDAVSRTGVIKREACEWTESAYNGEIGTGRFRVDDDSGNISVVGHKEVVTEQSACSSWPRLFTGFVGNKEMSRGELYTQGAGRSINVTTKDANDLLTRYIISDTDGKRGDETVDDRIAWLLASDYLSTLVADFGNVASSTLTMDKTDYRGQRPGDVLAACAKRAKFNFYVRWSVDETAYELVFRDDNASTDDTSTISISNVKADVNSTTVFAPFQDATLTEDPEDVYSGVYSSYSKGIVYKTRAATAAVFVARDGSTDDSGIKTAPQANAEATAFLWQSHTEEHTLSVTIRMRAAYVNLIRPGQRTAVSLTHLAQEGYDAGAYWRVLRRRVTQPLDTDNDYDVSLDLAPQEEAQEAEACSEDATEEGTYYPLGAPVPGTGGLPNVSDGVVYYFRGGISLPAVPTPGWQGGWHFPNWGAGGVGTIDYAGSCVENSLVFMTVGNGTWNIQTEAGGTARLLDVFVGPYYAWTHTDTISPGDAIEVVIDDADEDDCVRFVMFQDNSGTCGDYWGWSAASWVPA